MERLGKHIIRTSDRMYFKRCRESWNWGSKIRENYSPLVTPKPLEFGTAWHAALDTYYNPDTWHLVRNPSTRPAVQALTVKRFVDACNLQRKQYEEIKGDLFVELEEDFDERIELGKGMLKNYFKWAPANDDFTVIKREAEFEVPVLDDAGHQRLCECHSWPIFYQGRIDMLIQDPQGWYWIWEDKTTAQMNETSHLELDEQCGSYAWAMQHMLGVRIHGIVYNEVRKDYPSPPPRNKNKYKGRWFSVNKNMNTTYELYLQTLQDAGEPIEPYQEMLDFLKKEGNKFIRRTDVKRNSYELKEIGQRIAMEAGDMFDPGLRIYPNPTRINCSYCAFREPCVEKRKGGDYQFILDNLYVKNKEEVPV